MFGPPSSSTRGCSVWPRVSTERFCATIASASEHMISGAGTPDFSRPTMSVSANTPHLAATGCNLSDCHASAASASAAMPTFSTHLSMVAPVPEAHLSFIEAITRRSEATAPSGAGL